MADILFKDNAPDEEKEAAGRVIDLNTGDFADQAPIEQPPPPSVPQPTPFPEEKSFFHDMFGADSRASEELPELGQGGLLSGQDAIDIFAVTPAILTTLKNEEIADIITNQFPDIGKQYTPSGEIILANNNTGAKVVINKPGMSKLDLIQTLGISSAFTPAGKGAFWGTKGMSAAAPHVLARRVTQGMIGAGATQAGIEKLQETLGGQFDEDEMRIAAVFGGVAELAVPVIQSFRRAKVLAKTGSTVDDLQTITMDVNSAKNSADKVRNVTGQRVDLFQAQQTLIPSELLKQRLLPQLDAGSRLAATKLERQNKQAYEAVSKLFNTIAKPEVTATGAQQFKTVSKLAIEAAKQRRRAAASNLFEDALNAGADTDITGVTAYIKGFLENSVPGKQQATLRKILKTLKGKKGQPPTLRQLDNAKDNINGLLGKTGSGAEYNKTQRILINAKRQLVQAMEDASPTYKEGMDVYREMSPAVTQLEESILGQVSKIKDVDVKNIAQRIFDPKNATTNPSVIKNAKKVIDEIDPTAWENLLRVELNRRVGGLKQLIEDIPGELVGNVPGQLRRAIFGNPSQRNALLAGMSPAQRSNFIYLDDLLRRASSGRQAGSPTQPFKEATDKLRGSPMVLRDWIAHPVKSAQNAGEGALFDRNVRALTEVMFDTKYAKQFNQLKVINPESPAAAKALTQMLKEAQKDQ